MDLDKFLKNAMILFDNGVLVFREKQINKELVVSPDHQQFF